MEDAEPNEIHDEAAPAGDTGMDIDVMGDEEDLRKVLLSMERTQREQARETYDGILSLVSALGQDGRKYRREATKRLRAILSEVYSAPGSPTRLGGIRDWAACLDSPST